MTRFEYAHRLRRVLPVSPTLTTVSAPLGMGAPVMIRCLPFPTDRVGIFPAGHIFDDGQRDRLGNRVLLGDIPASHRETVHRRIVPRWIDDAQRSHPRAKHATQGVENGDFFKP